jgi:hypothetical protein
VQLVEAPAVGAFGMGDAVAQSLDGAAVAELALQRIGLGDDGAAGERPDRVEERLQHDCSSYGPTLAQVC